MRLAQKKTPVLLLTYFLIFCLRGIMRQNAGFREERPAKRQKLQQSITNMFGRIGPKFVEVVDSNVQKYFNHPATPSSPGQAVKRCC